MSYVDAFFDREADTIRIVERVNGKRVFKDVQAKYTFYYADPKGKYKSTYGEPLTRIVCKNTKEFKKEISINRHRKLFESDTNPIFQCLSEQYLGKDSPKLNVAFWDIETDFDPERGFAPVDNPFMPITAITVYLQWADALVTVAVPPKGLSLEQAQEMCNKRWPDGSVILFDNDKQGNGERAMLEMFLDLIEDADVHSGWNSEGYDVPYTVNRIKRVLSADDTRRFCLWDQKPKRREYEKFGKLSETYDTIGRVHMDYLNLYRKYTYEERHSYKLDAIGEYEVGENKTVYEGTLDQLYNEDFEKFIEYNRQDVALLDKLDKKLRFIDLANELAHANTVLLQTTMGAVAVTEQAIVNEAHRRGMQVPNRKEHETTGAAGAYVAYPKKGLHKWVGSMDLNSLYPSVIRSLNMAPESIVGQLRPEQTDAMIHEATTLKKKSFAAAWEGHFGSLEYEAVMEQRKDFMVTVDWEDGSSDVLSAAEVHKLVFDSNMPWMLSANGTIFTHEFEAVIPGILKRWYAERKELQAKLKEAIKAGDKDAIEYWDKRQLVKKINLNSLYGAILNPGCRFFDKRIGQSTTLTGRQIVKHMSAEVNKVTTGEYDHVGETVIYGDTDSVYFSAYPVLEKEIQAGTIPWSKDNVITLYNQIAEQVNSTFGSFMLDAFHCPGSRSDVIAAGREIVAESGLYISKKRYAALVIDDEGNRKDVDGKTGKVKAMGLDLRRADTPPYMQEFLLKILTRVLEGAEQQEIIDSIIAFRKDFESRPAWEKGTPKRVNNLNKFRTLEEKQGKANMPGHVRAALNWNTLKRVHGDKYSQDIVDGMKTIVCKLKPNPLGYTSIGYPTDELRLPGWFTELPFDEKAMAETIIDNKIDNLIGVLNYPLQDTKQTNTFNNLFNFGD